MATPDTVQKLIKLGFEVRFSRRQRRRRLDDAAYAEAGASIVEGADALWSARHRLEGARTETDPADGTDECSRLREGGWSLLIQPATSGPLIERLAARKATVIALDQIPRISRAQKMDVLSSMANIAGYRAVIEAANHFGSFFSGQITAAGAYDRRRCRHRCGCRRPRGHRCRSGSGCRGSRSTSAGCQGAGRELGGTLPRAGVPCRRVG